MVTKAKKSQTIDDLKAALLSAKITIVSDYKGTSVKELTQLRREIQKVGGDLTIAKNTLIKKALEGHESSELLGEYLQGPTALAYTSADPVPVAKAITEYIKKVKKTAIKGGILEGKKIDEKGIKAVSDLPSKEVLIAKLLGSMNAPAQNTVYALTGVSRNLVYALEAIRKQKENQ